VSAFKAYGRTAARIALGVVVAFGAVVPAVVPLLINFIDARQDVLVPAQAWFGPAALVTYLLLRRRLGRERTMREFLASDDVVHPTAERQSVEQAAPVSPAPAGSAPSRAKVDAG
jgi:hypothetical protein